MSALAPGRETFVPTSFSTWLQANHQVLYLPSVVIAEMAQGISKLRRGGGSVRADRLNLWLDGLLMVYADRILPIDAATAQIAG